MKDEIGQCLTHFEDESRSEHGHHFDKLTKCEIMPCPEVVVDSQILICEGKYRFWANEELRILFAVFICLEAFPAGMDICQSRSS